MIKKTDKLTLEQRVAKLEQQLHITDLDHKDLEKAVGEWFLEKYMYGSRRPNERDLSRIMIVLASKEDDSDVRYSSIVDECMQDLKHSFSLPHANILKDPSIREEVAEMLSACAYLMIVNHTPHTLDYVYKYYFKKEPPKIKYTGGSIPREVTFHVAGF